MLKKLGPGILVTAAFIGPGTITTASAAGAHFGLALLWALLFSVFATVVLQEMAARLGLVTREGLSEALRNTFPGALRWLVIALVLLAIGVGNTAYQAGNIIGAAVGLEILFGLSRPVGCLLIGAFAFLLLGVGIYKVMEKFLIGLVLLMSLVFLTTMLLVQPDVFGMLSGMLTPQIPTGSVLTIVALIGTTVVPYNLFLHSNTVREKWGAHIPVPDALRESRIDTMLSIALGGLMTMAITVTSAAAFFGSEAEFTAANMAEQLKPALGHGGKYFFALGMFSAGLSSAITAPLAAAYATCGVSAWTQDLKNPKFRMVWAIILVLGTIGAASGGSPLQLILFAQAANGILLPISAIFLLAIMNRKALLSNYHNGLWANVLGGIVVLIASALGGIQLLKVFGIIKLG